ncbi:anti-sigma factor [Streptomycetaceae bacterium NBC_01309]
MSHSKPETLALAALGEHVPDADLAHIATCPDCQAELEHLQAVVGVGRSVEPEDEPSAPPAGLWRRITDELADEFGPAPGANTGGSPGATAAGTNDAGRTSPVSGTAEDADASPAAVNGTAAPKGRWFRLRKSVALAASAAVIGAAAGVGGTLWATQDEDTPSTQVAAETRLEPLPAHQAVGAAYLDTGGGEPGRRLVIRVSGLTEQSGFYEVWLLDRDAQKMISVGLLPANGEATFDLPPNLDLAGYPVVDVSLQQYNGSPEHSGDSVVRGTLPG